jgi:undecaprenyl-diphosphatase
MQAITTIGFDIAKSVGLPAIALAGFREMWELYKIHLDGHGWSVLLLGLIVGSISAFFAIWGLMRILRNSRLGRS